MYELHRFISADYWGEVRTQLRAELGNIFVLPLCGAAGDQNPLDLVRISKDNKRELIVWNAQETEVDRSFDMLRECQQIGGRICDAVLRGYRQARNEIQTRPVFRTNCFEMDVPLRTVEKADVDAAGARIEAVKAACPAGRAADRGADDPLLRGHRLSQPLEAPAGDDTLYIPGSSSSASVRPRLRRTRLSCMSTTPTG